MHPSAVKNASFFFEAYFGGRENSGLKIIEIGSQDVNGSLRSVAPPNADYIGVDFVPAKGVDVVLDDPYQLPFDDDFADVILCSSCLEHSQMFWVVFLEIMRVLKPGGVFYLNVPSNGYFHRYPVDCWRFYPDAGVALVAWAKRNNINCALLESYVSDQQGDVWNDFVGVFLKDDAFVQKYPVRILHGINGFKNGFLFGKDGLVSFSEVPEDLKRLNVISRIALGKVGLGK